MRIHVEGDYWISYDGMNHTLEQEGTVGKGGKSENIGAKKGYKPRLLLKHWRLHEGNAQG